MRPPLAHPLSTGGPIAEHQAWKAANLLNYKKRTDPEFVRSQDLREPCLQVCPTNTLTCWLPEGHTGKHSWQTPKDPSDCEWCGKDSCDGSCS